MNASEFEQIFPIGDKNDAFAEYFIGQSYVKLLSTDGITAVNVTFEPGCRNNWHIHRGGEQLLLCTAGHGWYQEEGKLARRLSPGDVVNIPADVKHWHGATSEGWFAHLAISVPAEDAKTDWYEPVSDEEYENVERDFDSNRAG